MSITVHSGDTVLFTGDSVTSRGWFYSGVGGLSYLLNNQATKHNSTASGSQATNSGSQGFNMGLTFVNTGTNGATSADVAANVASRITNFNPNVVVILIGVNDVSARTDPTVTNANVNSALSAIQTALPSAKLALVSILCEGENWTAGPPVAFVNPPTDAILNQDNTNYQALCVTYGATYIDVRTPLLAWEQVNNAPAPGAAQLFTGEGVHPIIPTNETIMGKWAFPFFTVVP